MTNPMILQLKQTLAECKNKKKELELKIKRNFAEIQANINPYFTDSRQIKAAEIEQAADELLESKNKLAQIEQKIEEIQEELS